MYQRVRPQTPQTWLTKQIEAYNGCFFMVWPKNLNSSKIENHYSYSNTDTIVILSLHPSVYHGVMATGALVHLIGACNKMSLECHQKRLTNHLHLLASGLHHEVSKPRTQCHPRTLIWKPTPMVRVTLPTRPTVPRNQCVERHLGSPFRSCKAQ